MRYLLILSSKPLRQILRLLAVITLFLAGITPPVWSQAELPTNSGGEVAKPTETKEVRQALPSGVRLLVAEQAVSPTIRRVVPLVAIDLRVRVGSTYETGPTSGLSHMVEHMLFKGTDSGPYTKPGAIDTAMENLGGEVSASTSKDWTRFAVVVPADKWRDALSLVAALVLHPAIRQEDLDKERQVILSEMRVARAEPLRTALAAVALGIYPPDDPNGFSLYGPETNVRRFQADDVRNWWRNHYTPANMTLAVAGPLKAMEVAEFAATLFPVAEASTGTNVTATVEVAAIPFTMPFGATHLSDKSLARSDRALSTVVVAFPSPIIKNESSLLACDVLMPLLLGENNAGGRLYDALVRKKIALSVGGDFLMRRGDTPGMFALFLTGPTGSEKRMEEALVAALTQIKEDGISNDEIEAARRIALGRWQAQETSVEGHARRLAFYDSIDADGFAQTYRDKIAHLTPVEIQAALVRYLTPSRYAVAVIAPPTTKPSATEEVR